MVLLPILAISLVLSYLLGSIPTAYLFGKLFKGIDIRQHGSGNVGATNALRVLGKPMGITTLLLDIFKGWLAVTIARTLFGITIDWALVLVGLIAVIGHIFTIFLKFKGGKGVATTFGIFLALTPLATLFTMIIFVLVLGISRYMSVASLVNAVLFPILIYILNGNWIYTTLGIVLGIFIIIRHSSNIKRLMDGTESRFSFGKRDNS